MPTYYIRLRRSYALEQVVAPSASEAMVEARQLHPSCLDVERVCIETGDGTRDRDRAIRHEPEDGSCPPSLVGRAVIR